MDYRELGGSCTGNISYLLSVLLNVKKIDGAELRPYRTIFQKIKDIIHMTTYRWICQPIWRYLSAEPMSTKNNIHKFLCICFQGNIFPRCILYFFSTSRGCQTTDMKSQKICPKESQRKWRHGKLHGDNIYIIICRKYVIIEMLLLTVFRTCKQLRVNRFSNLFFFFYLQNCNQLWLWFQMNFA